MTHRLRIPLHSSGRAKPQSFMYFRMCARSLVRYRSLADQLNRLDHLDAQYDALFNEVEEAAVEPVVFAGMCVEATLYDLGACLFGSAFVEHTDKLDPLSKYFVISRFIDRADPDKSGITYQSLQALVSARNKLIHYKSKSMLEDDLTKILREAAKEHEQHIKGISASFRALVLLSLHFDGNIFEELRIIPSFKKPEYWRGVVPTELHQDVEWCIQASKEERVRAQSPPKKG